MKRRLNISLLAVFAICCCQKEELKVQPMESTTFTATIEDNLGDTKTSLDGHGNVLWKKGNRVSIFNGSTINQQFQVSDASDGKTSAELNPVSSAGFIGGGEIDNNVAFYPYSSTAAITNNEGAYVISGISLPAIQNYSTGSFGDGAFPMVATTCSTSDQNLKFKNILGCLKIQLKGTANITSIAVTGNNNEILCGTANVISELGNVPSISLTDESAKTVTLDCGSGIPLNTSTSTPFVIALPPMTMTGGFTVIVTDTEGMQMEIKTTKSQTITRSSILKMPEVNYEGADPCLKDPFTISSVGNISLSFGKEGSPDPISLEYRIESGSWSAYSIGDAVSLTDGETIQFRSGEGGNSTFSKGSDYYVLKVIGTGTIKASGNIMSLLDRTLEKNDMPVDGFMALFEGCDKLTDASKLILPATTLASNCYLNMFSGCTSLTTAPKLPATTLAVGCYGAMFYGCTSLIAAPELPATTLAEVCYIDMFYGCTSLTTAPKLPATTLAKACYFEMFSGCTSLTSVLELSATTLADGCCIDMFSGCTSLTNAPELPATTLAESCYNVMFSGCTSLTTTPKLPATTLAKQCYDGMFSGCTSLITAPELPAITLMHGCYMGMFRGCTSLITAPELPATTLANYCYQNMFFGCTSLIAAPELPAITLTDGCYLGMFRGCTSLTTAPELPATTLANYCYQSMFFGCTSLITAPELPAITLTNGCYSGMFRGCSKLNYVKALFTTTPSDTYTKDWLSYVSSTGKFIKSKDATWNVRGTYGIPEGWTVQTDDEDTKGYFTITSVGSTTVSIAKVGNPDAITLEYRKGSGSWSAYAIGTAVDLTDGETIQYRAGEEGNSVFSKRGNDGTFEYYVIIVNGKGKIKASGNIMSLLDKTLERKDMPVDGFLALFKDCDKLTDASKLILPATTLAKECYFYMFDGCKSLTTPPELPATTLANDCYLNMFSGCTSLTTTPELPATTLADRCYDHMFSGCTSLTSAPELPATTLAEGCYFSMFYGCTSLITAPELPATTLAKGCYGFMFESCTSLTQAPELSVVTLSEECYYGMFHDCTSLATAPELPASTLANSCYQHMFSGCTSLTTAPELPATTLAEICYYCMFGGCTSLTKAPELPATSLAGMCYGGMFCDCTSLITAPELPATTLAGGCYFEMFDGCTSLITAPELPATTLAEGCYYEMFSGCSKLNYVKALFTTTPSDTYTKDWLSNVSSAGIFVKSKDASWNVTGSNGIPSGWTVQTE